ncbi:hypothetical protein ABIF26_005494 [Bradyrhizobium elkanii]|uniref:Uncharacterized protein n=1 Tax=Bradyrhizobium elkanii TaxID=29448 RepID=A0A8I1Y468_BRAEL|nr:hypothetical protein [Bradyrhizobium elkanii]
MRATIEDRSKSAVESLGLEAEVAAWRSKRNLRPLCTTGKVPVVRIRRCVRPASLSALSADRPLAAVPR